MSPDSSCAFGPRQVPFIGTDAGWSSSVARRAHNPEVAGSNPVPATSNPVSKETGFLHFCQLIWKDSRIKLSVLTKNCGLREA